MSNRYFHLSPTLLEVGSIIKPGNFGRVIECYRSNNMGPMTVRELTFEIARLKNFADRPSRFKSVFLFPTLEHAMAHLQRFDVSSLIYEVELTEPNEGVFHGNMGLVHFGIPNEQMPVIPFLYQLAAQYWLGIDSVQPDSELLTMSPIRIVAFHDHRIPPEQYEQAIAAAKAASNQQNS